MRLVIPKPRITPFFERSERVRSHLPQINVILKELHRNLSSLEGSEAY